MPCRLPATLQLPSSRPRFRPELVDSSLLRLGFVRSNFKRIYECKGFYGPRETRNGSSDPPTWCEFVPCTILIYLGTPVTTGPSRLGPKLQGWHGLSSEKKKWRAHVTRLGAKTGQPLIHSKPLLGARWCQRTLPCLPGQNDIVDQVHKSQHMYLSLSHTHTKVAWYSDILD
jgi:hypothetical protein